MRAFGVAFQHPEIVQFSAAHECGYGTGSSTRVRLAGDRVRMRTGGGEKAPLAVCRSGLLLLCMFAGDATASDTHPRHAARRTRRLLGQNRPLRRIGDTSDSTDNTGSNVPQLRRDRPAPSRIGRIPTFEAPAAAGAASTGFDSLSRKKTAAKTQARRLADRHTRVSPTVAAIVSPRRAPPEVAVAQPVQITPVVVPVAPPPPPLPSAATANRPRLAPSMMGTGPGPAATAEAAGRRRSVRRGRLLSRQHAGEARHRTLDRLRHQPGPRQRRQGFVALHGRAGTAGRLRLAAAFADRRPARLVHRLFAEERGVGSAAAGQHRPAGFHRQDQRAPRRLARHEDQHRNPLAASAPTIPAARTSRPIWQRYPLFFSLRQHARRRPRLQSLRDRGERHGRPHRLPGIDAERRIALEQQRPQLQPVSAARCAAPTRSCRISSRSAKSRSIAASATSSSIATALRAARTATPRGSARRSSSAG